MANGPTSFVPEDVMRLFAQSFSSGTGANDAAQRIGLARTAQNQEFQLGTAKLALQNQQLEQERIDTGAKIALQRENLASDAALKGQEIALRAQESAKSFFLRQQAMEQDKLNFAEQIRVRKAAEDFKRTTLALNLEELERETKMKQGQLELAKQRNDGVSDYKQAALDQQKQKQEETNEFKKLNLLSQEVNRVRKEAFVDPKNEFMGVKPDFAAPGGGVDDDKVWEIAKSRVNRLMDSTGGSVQSFPNRPTETSTPASSPTQEPTSQYREGPLTLLTEKIKKELAALKSGETTVIDGKTYKKK
jgi:hypothetical protein